MFGLIDGRVLESYRRYQGIRAGVEVETPGGPGKVAGKQIWQGQFQVLVDHGERAGGCVVVMAYAMGMVKETYPRPFPNTLTGAGGKGAEGAEVEHV